MDNILVSHILALSLVGNVSVNKVELRPFSSIIMRQKQPSAPSVWGWACLGKRLGGLFGSGGGE